MQHAASSAILVSGWHRMSYSYSDGSVISQLLVEYIKKVHGIVGNAITEGKYIVFGSGSTQLLNAAVYALSLNSSMSPAKVVATTPYYPVSSINILLLYTKLKCKFQVLLYIYIYINIYFQFYIFMKSCFYFPQFYIIQFNQSYMINRLHGLFSMNLWKQCTRNK